MPQRTRREGSPDSSRSQVARESRPDHGAWRADALSGSRHSRWVDELRQPLHDDDLGKAREICAQVCRQALRDFAPGLLLLPAETRLRLQALTAYTLTLFDFVRQTGLEGERLTAINRWEFELESSLDGKPPGQPVFVLVRHLEKQAPWDRDSFDRLHAFARRRCAQLRPPDREALERDASILGATLLQLLVTGRQSVGCEGLAAALVRLRGLTDLGDHLRRHRPQLPVAELPEFRDLHQPEQATALSTAVARECRAIRTLLGRREDLRSIPGPLQPAARYAYLAAGRLLSRIESNGSELVTAEPRLGLMDRLSLLLLARWR